MRVEKKRGCIYVSQFLALEGRWDIFTVVGKTKNKCFIQMMLRLPYKKTHKDVILLKIYFPSLNHIVEWGSLLMEMSKLCQKTSEY